MSNNDATTGTGDAGPIIIPIPPSPDLPTNTADTQEEDEQDAESIPTTAAAATTYSQEFRRLYCDGHVRGEFLFQHFWDYFGSWGRSDLNKIRKSERDYLRDDLRFYGVYVRRSARLGATEALLVTLQTEQNVWPEDQLQSQIQKYPESAQYQDRGPMPTFPPRQVPPGVRQTYEFAPTPKPMLGRIHAPLADYAPRNENGQRVGSYDSLLASTPARVNNADEDLYNASPRVNQKREFSHTHGREPSNALPAWRQEEHPTA